MRRDVAQDGIVSNERDEEMALLKGQLDMASTLLRRYQNAYQHLVTHHATLMLAAMTPEAIRDELNVYGPLTMTEDCIEDLRAELNQQRVQHVNHCRI
jgi:phage shock protein A